MGDRAIATRQYAPRLPAEERRRQVLDATLELIANDGYRASTMEAIARKVGVAKPVIYDLFGTRGALLLELLEREERRALDQLAAAIPQADGSRNLREMVASGFEAFLVAVAENPDAWRLILLPPEATPQVVRDYVDRGRERVVSQLAKMVEWAAQVPGFPEVDAELVAHGIIATGEHFARLALSDPARFPPERFGRFAGVIMNRALLGPEPSSG